MSWDDEDTSARPLWLITLADLALLLVGFFVLLQANQRMDPNALAAGIRAGFGLEEAAAAAMPLELASVEGFEAGSAIPGDAEAAIAWARTATRDPRTRLKISGEVDGSAADVDPYTGSGAILAADRARAVAELLVGAGVAAPGRIEIVTATGKRRALLSIGFDGGRQ